MGDRSMAERHGALSPSFLGYLIHIQLVPISTGTAMSVYDESGCRKFLQSFPHKKS